MCGIAGIFAYNIAAPAPSATELAAVSAHMKLRGPDGAGEWWSEDRRLGLAHRRLAIIDPVERAAQPMISADGRYTITFNGEIYNHFALRAELEASGTCFRTQSDTEVVLKLFGERGPAIVRSLRGMFAFAIYDSKAKSLFLARDPYGVKPLYYANDGWTFRLASQVKALLAGNSVSRDIEPAGAVGFHLYGSVPEPFTLYRAIRAMPAGTTVLVDAAGVREPKPYASIAGVLATATPHSMKLFEPALREAVLGSVRHHLVADVEVGAFLSGGVDSGALVGLMRDCGQEKIRTVTLSYGEFSGSFEDEAPLAAMTASLYETAHTERRVTKSEFLVDLPKIFDAMDQPSIDGINTWFVSKAIRELGLKVALSGLGGDELLAGYPSFSDIPRWTCLFGIAGRIPLLGRMARIAGGSLFPSLAASNPKALSMLEYGGTYPGAYLLRRGLFLPHELDAVLTPELAREGLYRLDPLGLLQRTLPPPPATAVTCVAALEACNYMRNQLLRDADWAGMAQSVEIRVPLVDYTLLEQVAPWIGGLVAGAGKRAMAAAPRQPLPETIVNRPKTGFGVPLCEWLTREDAAQGAQKKGLSSRAWARQVYNRLTATVAQG